MQDLPTETAEGDLLMDRLINGEPSRVGRCISEWGDPLSTAVLAVCLLKRPDAEIARREQEAQRAGRGAEAAFWHETLNFFVAVTTPSGGATDIGHC